MKLKAIFFCFSLLTILTVIVSLYFYYDSIKTAALNEDRVLAASHVKAIDSSISQMISRCQRIVLSLSRHKELSLALLDSSTANLEQANHVLDLYNTSLQTDVCYLLDKNGLTVASSNRPDKDSFIGKNYAFRPYFQEAIGGKPAVFMALGVTSGKRGIYFSAPIFAYGTDTIMGVSVIKQSIDKIENDFLVAHYPTHGQHNDILAITNEIGMIFISDKEDLLYNTLWEKNESKLDPNVLSRQFGEGPWSWAGFKKISPQRAVDRSNREYAFMSVGIQEIPNWRIVHLSDTDLFMDELNASFFKTSGVVFLSVIVVIGSALFLLNYFANKAEKALRESEEKFRNIAENSLVGVNIIKEDHFVYVNPKFAEIFGYTVEECLNNLQFQHIVHPDDAYTVQEQVRKRMSGEVENVNYAFRGIRKSGRIINVEIFGSKIFLNGKPAITGILMDITDRRRAEEALRESEEKLARSKKMESLGLLAGGVAHDLNNVLSGIISYPELILMDLPEDSKFREPVKTIMESGRRAAEIVQDLLTVARGVAINKEIVNLNDSIGEYLDSPEFAQLQLLCPKVTVETDLDAALFNINGSQVHIRKVLTNLVLNAAEAIEADGTVVIATMNRYVDRPLKGYEEVTIGEYVVVSVSDDGTGISSLDLDRIFEPFYTKKVMGRSGTGLGLAVVWNILLDHKGYIDVKSDQNGTTFELYFPMTREELSNQALSIPMDDYSGNGELILVVDDMQNQRDIACRMLEVLGYQTVAVSSGEDAVEYLRDNPADLLLLDMIMDPGINGHETYKRIKKIQPKQKAIIVSGFAVTEDVKAAQNLGAGKYIKKPYTVETIGLAVKEELAMH